MNQQNSELTEPLFEARDIELMAVAVMQLLSNRSISVNLKPHALKHVESLAHALKTGNKANVFKLSTDFYAELLSPEIIAAAYAHVRNLHLSGTPEFQIVMDSLKEIYEQHLNDNHPVIMLDEAIMVLLLAITRNDKNAIFYTRIDEQTGKPRPTTFPLTDQLIENFLLPFGDKKQLIKRVLLIHKKNVIGNPLVEVAYRYQQRKHAYEQAKEEYEKSLAELSKQDKNNLSIPATASKMVQDIDLLTTEFDKLMEYVKEPESQNAIANSFKVPHIKQLQAAYKTSQQIDNDDFNKKLSGIYRQTLEEKKAKDLSARLASRMKRLMSKMGNWKEEYWQEYQFLMQKNGIWEGEDWLNKWRSKKTGKQIIEKSGQDYLVQEKGTSVQDLLDKDKKRQDKQRGKHMLSEHELLAWMKKEPSKAPPEQQKVLQALSNAERLSEVVNLCCDQQDWQKSSLSLQGKIYKIFTHYSDTDLDTIKSEVLQNLEKSEVEIAKKVMAQLELGINKLSSLIKRDHRLSYPQAFDILSTQELSNKERERLNSKEYLSSPAAQYGKYQSV